MEKILTNRSCKLRHWCSQKKRRHNSGAFFSCSNHYLDFVQCGLPPPPLLELEALELDPEEAAAELDEPEAEVAREEEPLAEFDPPREPPLAPPLSLNTRC